MESTSPSSSPQNPSIPVPEGNVAVGSVKKTDTPDGSVHIQAEGQGNIFSGTGDVNIGGDVVDGDKVAGDKVTNNYYGAQPSKIRAPSVIPYLVNREEVEEKIRNVVSLIPAQPTCSPFSIVHGRVDEAHDQLLLRIEQYELPELLPESKPKVQLIQPRIPKNFSSRDDLFDQIREQLGMELANLSYRGKFERHSRINRDSSREDIASAITEMPAPLMIASSTVVSRWGEPGPTDKVLDLIDGYVAFWQEWSAEFKQSDLFLFLVLQYGPEDKPSLLNRFKTGFRSAKSINYVVETHVESMQDTAYPNLHFSVMPKLKEITLDDLLNWCRMTATRKWPTVPEIQVTSDFEQYQREMVKSTMSMKIAGQRLTVLLEKRNYELGGN